MIRLKDIRMQPKLIGLMLLVSLIPLGLVAWLSSWSATNALLDLSTNQLESMREVKHAQITRFFNEREGDMGVLMETTAALLAAETSKMQAIQDLKVSNLRRMFKRINGAVHLSKDDPLIGEAFNAFNQAFSEGLGTVALDGEAAAHLGPIGTEGGNDYVPFGLDGRLELGNVAGPICRLGQEVEDRPVMPDRIAVGE